MIYIMCSDAKWKNVISYVGSNNTTNFEIVEMFKIEQCNLLIA